MAFHHIDPLTKEIELNVNKIKGISWERVLEEAKKCQLLCMNCHTEKHYKDYKYKKERKNYKYKIRLIEIKGGCCINCKYNKNISVLGFHHRNPQEKSFNISKNKNKSWDEILEEVKKTDLLCSNCHHEIHDQSITKEEAFKSFRKHVRYIYTCKTCTKEFSHKRKNRKYCSQKCNAKSKILPMPEGTTRESLTLELMTSNYTKMSKKYNIDRRRLQKYIQEY